MDSATLISSRNAQSNNIYFGPQQMSDLLLSNLVMSKFGDILKENFTLSLKTIGKFLLLMSVNDIKALLTNMLSQLFPLLKQLPIFIYAFVHKMAPHYRNFKRIDPAPQTIVTIEPTDYQLFIEIDTNFMAALYRFIHKNPTCKFNKSIIGVRINNSKDKIIMEKITDISLNIKNKTIYIINELDYEINIATKEPVSSMVGSIKIKNKSTSSYLDFLTEAQRDIVELTKKKFRQKSSSDMLARNVTSFSGNFTEYDLSQILVAKYPNLILEETFFEITIICALCGFANPNIEVMHIALESLQKNGSMSFDPCSKYVNIDKNVLLKPSYSYGLKNRAYMIDHSAKSFSELQIIFKDFIDTTSNKITSENTSLKITIQMAHDANIPLSIEKFIKKIYKHNKKSNTSIKINYLLLENEKIITEKSNPEYETWLEKKKFLDEIKTTGKELDIRQVYDLIHTQIPPKTIIEETTKQKITLKLLNEVIKDFDTLYLRKTDKEKLLSSLYQFRDKKDVLRNLGLPNKLNILLYGEPGTGKTTTIQAVATYLNKDLYYIDLKEAKTNQDLQIMFEYVNKNVPNGGIVVIEDIDAMIDVVLKRKLLNDSDRAERSEYKVNELVSNQKNKLSLEFLLNILQGTLTLDDSIFIVTTNYINHLDPAFYRDGRFDVKLELKLCDQYQIESIYNKILGRKIPEHFLKRIPDNKYSPATIIFHLKDYIFNTDASDEMILDRFFETA